MMKRLNTLMLCVLIAPAFAFGMNQGQDEWDRDQQSMQQPEAERQMERDRDTRMTHAEEGDFLSAVPTSGVSVDSLMGSTVKTRAGREDIGNVEDILVDQDGQPIALLVSAGGFLGIGERDVAVNWNKVTIVHDGDNDNVLGRDDEAAAAGAGVREGDTWGNGDLSPDNYVVLVDITEDQLENAPEFDRNW